MSITSDRIREQGFFHPLADDAADEIEEMEKRIAELERQRGKLLEALEILLGDSEDSDYMSASEQRQKARAAIAEVRGEK